MGYNHISIFERESILLGTLQGLSIAKIAESLSRSKSTISRELKRNSDNGEYSPIIADCKYKSRRENCKTDKKPSDKMLCDFVADRFLNHQWPPEQIAERAELEAGGFGLGYHTICRGIKDGQFDKYGRADEPLKASRKLRHKGRKRYEKGINDEIDENEKFSETLLNRSWHRAKTRRSRNKGANRTLGSRYDSRQKGRNLLHRSCGQEIGIPNMRKNQEEDQGGG